MMPDGTVWADSWEIAAGAGMGTIDEELKTMFDTKLGPCATIVTWYLIRAPFKCYRGFADEQYQGPFQLLYAPVYRALLHPLLMRILRKVIGYDAKFADAVETIDRVFAHVGDQLNLSGHSYLGGETPGLADFAFAALSKMLVMPDDIDDGPTTLMAAWRIRTTDLGAAGHPSDPPPELTALIARYRATPAGQLVLRVYKRHRREVLPAGR